MRWNMPRACAAMVVGVALPLTVSNIAGASARLTRFEAETGQVTASSTPHGWVAHSAYGLQLSVPKDWTVAYSANCPSQAPGTLLIGTPTYDSFCVYAPPDTNLVTMQPGISGQVDPGPAKRLVVHGLIVFSHSTEDSTFWVVPSRHVMLSARGPRSYAVLKTLSVATADAQAAPGMLNGNEYLMTTIRTPVTGPISIVRLDSHGPPLPDLNAFNGQFSATLPPGRYVLTGHDGNAACLSARATVRSGLTTRVSLLDCQGD